MKYIVKVSNERMPAGCWGRYKRVGVLAVNDGVEDVAMISERARGVIAVVRVWGRLHCGTTTRCAFEVALVKAKKLCGAMNAQIGGA